MKWRHKLALQDVRAFCDVNGQPTFMCYQIPGIAQSLRKLHEEKYIEKTRRVMCYTETGKRCYRQVWRLIK